MDSKSFDNSVLCTNESVLICEEAARDNLLRHLNREGAYLLADDERDRVRDLVFPNGSFDVRFVGKDAAVIAAEAGVRVAGDTRILLAPFDLVVPEEPLAHEKLCPILGFVTVPNAEPRHRRCPVRAPHHRSRALGGHPQLEPEDDHGLLRLGAGARVVVNVGNSLGSSGIETNLAPTMTVGTGYFGRSSVAENLQPKHLTQWTQVAYNSDASEPFGNFAGLTPWERPHGHVPPYPLASNLVAEGPAVRAGAALAGAPVDPYAGVPATGREAMTPEAERLREGSVAWFSKSSAGS